MSGGLSDTSTCITASGTDCKDFPEQAPLPPLDKSVHFQQCLDLLGDVLTAVGHTMRGAWKLAKEWAKDVANAVVNLGHAVANELKKVGRTLAGWVESGVKWIGDSAYSILQGAGELMPFGRRLSVDEARALKWADISALMAWFEADSMVSADQLLANTTKTPAEHAVKGGRSVAMSPLPPMPPRERLQGGLTALVRAVNASVNDDADWGAVEESSLQLVDRLVAWHSYSEAARDFQESAPVTSMQRELERVRDCIDAVLSGAQCATVEHIEYTIEQLKLQKLETLVQAAEALYAQRRQFAYQSLEVPRTCCKHACASS